MLLTSRRSNMGTLNPLGLQTPTQNLTRTYVVHLTTGEEVEVKADSFDFSEPFSVFSFHKEGLPVFVAASQMVAYVGRIEDGPTEASCTEGLCPNGPGCKWDAKRVLEIRVSAPVGVVSDAQLRG